MQKVGILTLYYQNYNMGGTLQAYALQRAVTKEGFDAEQICYQYKKPQNNNVKQKIKGNFENYGVAKGFYRCSKLAIKSFLTHSIFKSENRKIKSRIQRYDDFFKRIPHSKSIYTSKNIDETLKNYDIFICGSDQIWCDAGINANDKDYGKVFTLQFVDKEKIKFSYAASIGHLTLLKEFLDQLTPGIRSLDAISVREESSKICISQTINKEIRVVVDPVLLLDVSEWDHLCDSTKLCEYQEPYIFCYFLGMDKNVRSSIRKFAKKVGLKILTLPYILNGFNFQDLNWGDIKDFEAGPAEFVKLIRNSRLVLTDSYHAMVFSVIFHKPFYVFERSTKVRGETMSMRITDFLSEYGLEDRLINKTSLDNKKEVEPIDYKYTDSVLKESTQESKAYLRESLGL